VLACSILGAATFWLWRGCSCTHFAGAADVALIISSERPTLRGALHRLQLAWMEAAAPMLQRCVLACTNLGGHRGMWSVLATQLCLLSDSVQRRQGLSAWWLCAVNNVGGRASRPMPAAVQPAPDWCVQTALQPRTC
jgi:hypothetical protein